MLANASPITLKPFKLSVKALIDPSPVAAALPNPSTAEPTFLKDFSYFLCASIESSTASEN